MGIMSLLAKADGYYVTMAPAQSYMAPWTSEVSLSLQLKDPDWERSIPGLNFAYHGRNSYAYLWALYENAFDLVIVQLYEGLDPANAVAASIRELLTPWKISLGENPDSDTLTVRIKPSQLIVGLANGWADNQKFLFVEKNSLRDAWRQTGGQFRGFGFWTIAEEGTRQHGREPIYLAKELKDIMSERVIDNELR
ncbi:hypothetical protein BDR26DRAFT_868217 [Obelidium mucronatum]|nr:hypothetical protein BDR26DRAFT_868217 [Obelidium mucronatum]